MDLWAYQSNVHLDFIRPGRPLENGYIESFNGRPRDECLNVDVFFTLADARRKLDHFRDVYNHHRPHSALADRTPAEFAALCGGGNDGERTALENAARFPHFPRTTATANDRICANVPAKRALTEPHRPKSLTSCGRVFRGGSSKPNLMF